MMNNLEDLDRDGLLEVLDQIKILVKQTADQESIDGIWGLLQNIGKLVGEEIPGI